MAGRGRRPGGEDTRSAIVDAARGEFAEKGYDKTSLRGVARVAGVDPALVHHYFEGKADLFAQTLAVPINPAVVFDRVFAGDRDRLGWRLAETFLAVWDPPERRETILALIRGALTTDEAARLLREFLVREVCGRLATATGVPDPELRGALAASQLIGMAMLRYVLRAPGLAEASVSEVVERLGPVLQHHLVDGSAAEE